LPLFVVCRFDRIDVEVDVEGKLILGYFLLPIFTGPYYSHANDTTLLQSVIATNAAVLSTTILASTTTAVDGHINENMIKKRSLATRKENASERSPEPLNAILSLPLLLLLQ